jgi:hypothetical protein
MIRVRREIKEAEALAHLKSLKRHEKAIDTELTKHAGSLFPGGACEFMLGFLKSESAWMNRRAISMIQNQRCQNVIHIYGNVVVLDRIYPGGFRKELSANDIALFIGSRAKR